MALTDSLVGYWKADEASGNLLDAVGSNDLTDNNTVTTAAGKISTARLFTSANSEYFDKAENATLSVDGDTAFTLQAWVKLTTKAAQCGLIGKFNDSAGGREFLLYYNVGSDRFTFGCDFAGGVGFAQVAADSFGSPSTGVFYLIHCWHDPTTDHVHISVNAGTADQDPVGTGGNVINASTANFALGTHNGGNYLNGAMDEIGLWKRVLTAGDRTDLYNGGIGFAYPFSAAGDAVEQPIFGYINNPVAFGF